MNIAQLKNGNVLSIYVGNTPIMMVYLNGDIIWPRLINTNPISCFYNGYWDDNYPWIDDIPWVD